MKEKNTLKRGYTIAFYNVENLFDTQDNPKTLDDDFTPEGRKKWTSKRYSRKLKKISTVIAQIGMEATGFPPAIIGLAEVENKQVINDLIATENLKHSNYGLVHFDASDERGIEVALLYRKKIFELIHAEAFTLLLTEEGGERDYTRDILWVKGKLKGVLMHFIVNHWPSRRNGTKETVWKRVKAANLVHDICAKINVETPNAPIIIMGDFNDDPTSISIKKHLVTPDFYNPFESLFAKGYGTSTHEDNWHLFDQIILSKTLLNGSAFQFKYAAIFNEKFITEWKGKHKGDPFRTYIGKWHQGGFSDHFPVYIELELKD